MRALARSAARESGARLPALAAGWADHVLSALVSTVKLMLVHELTDGMEVDQVLLIREAERRPRRDGGEYLRLQLGDRSGAVVCMVWEEIADAEELARAGEAVRVRGRFILHPRFGPQINLRALEPAEPGSFQMADLLDGPARPLGQMEGEIRELVATVQQPHLRVLLERLFGDLNAKQADYLKDIHGSGRHLLSLINDILDLAKVEAGRMDLDLSTFHLPTALSNAMTLIRERAQRHSIQLGLDVDPRLSEMEADERKVKQILLNLLSNAVKFTPDGGRVDVIAKMDTTKVAIAVKDTGIGIAPEDHAAVFEEFKQVGRDYTRKAEGTGLGLALTKRFVELHGGEISLTSAPGKGSTFTITIPIRH